MQANPDDARLLCALGDLTLEPQHYEEAWRTSGCRSSRAQRSLARFSMAKSEFKQASPLQATLFRMPGMVS